MLRSLMRLGSRKWRSAVASAMIPRSVTRCSENSGDVKALCCHSDALCCQRRRCLVVRGAACLPEWGAMLVGANVGLGVQARAASKCCRYQQSRARGSKPLKMTIAISWGAVCCRWEDWVRFVQLNKGSYLPCLPATLAGRKEATDCARKVVAAPNTARILWWKRKHAPETKCGGSLFPWRVRERLTG